MKELTICHYCYGLEPFKRGGTPAFVDFLLEKQKDNELILLYPGHYRFFNKKQVIKKSRLYKKNQLYKAYEIVNPKPIPICNGVNDIDLFVSNYPLEMWDKFFEENKVDIVHVHTLFGLDSTFFDACKKHNVKTVFTSHDIFGLCPRTVPLFFEKCKGKPSELCGFCSKYALSMRQNIILQSNLYNKYKQFKFLKLIRQKKKNERVAYQKEQNQLSEEAISKLFNQKSEKYEKLQNYYLSLVNRFDFVHFNSTLSQETFLRFCKPKAFSVIPISHTGISDNRKTHTKIVDSTKISFLIMGTNKGLYQILDILDEIWKEGITNFELNIYSGNECEEKPFVHKYGEYTHSDLIKIYNQNDLLIYNESSFASYSFIVAESLSYGVPVLVSGYVGARDLVKKLDGGFVVESDKEKIKEAIKSILLNSRILKEKTSSLHSAPYNFECENFVDLYKKVLKEN